MENAYTILNLDTTATIVEIKKRYRKLALQYHPDKNKTLSKKEAESKFREITHAYKILTDEQYAKTYEDENTEQPQYYNTSFTFEDDFLRGVFEMFDTNMDFMDSFFNFQQPNIQREYHTTEYNNLYNDLIETNITTDIDMVANMLEGLDVIENMILNTSIINQYQYINQNQNQYQNQKNDITPKYKTYKCYLNLKDIYNMKHKRILLQQSYYNQQTPKYIHIKSYIKEQYFPDIRTNIIIKDKISKPTLKDYNKNKKSGIITIINRFRDYDILITTHIKINYIQNISNKSSHKTNQSNIKIKYKYLDDKYYTLTLKQSYLLSIGKNEINKNKNKIYQVNQLKNRGLYNPEIKKRGNVYISINII